MNRAIVSVRRQRGASALEFALVFPLFFLILFAIIHYGVLFMVEQGIVMAAEEGARSAIAVDPAEDDYSGVVCGRVEKQVREALDWMPEAWYDHLVRNCNVDLDHDPASVTVTVSYPGYSAAPLVPALGPIDLPMLPAMTTLPPLPESIAAQARVQL